MKDFALLLLRVSVGLLVLIWGIDKIVDPTHAVAVSDRFYRGTLSAQALAPVLGVAQCAVALLAIGGLFRRLVDPVIALINLGTLIAVYRSILDPWGWYLEGTNNLFFPSLAIFAASLLLVAMRSEEAWVLDRRRSGMAIRG